MADITRSKSAAILVAIALTVVLTCTFTTFSKSTKGFEMSSSQEKTKVRAPEIEGGRGWLNVDRPLSIAGLKGKVILLDFWTYGCINCIHIIPDLKRLEAKYPNELVVIGVHSAKFENEKDTENIRRIIMRYEIEHPVYNDADYKVWQSYGVRAWPTQVIIDPAGYAVGAVSGEGNYELIEKVIAETIAEFKKRGELNEEPLKLSLERAKVGDLPLAFPGKILADAASDRLFIADSNHNRIVVTKLDGTLVETIGTGVQGAKDGSFSEATFFRPQGLALEGTNVYVADTGNHLIRRVDLATRKVETVAGTGKQSYEYFKTGPGPTIGLNSPWDLEIVGKTLYITMAGPHQIWKYDLEKREVSTFAGSGREIRRDGPLLEAGFAQPSGITSNGKSLFIADSESNIIREIDLAKGVVTTLVGGDLFEFGDADGKGDEVRLQHPLGVYALGKKVLIADTYNHKIKQLDPSNRSVETFAGKGKPGQTDGPTPSFYEPGGLSVAKGKLFIADTNNHAVRVLDLKSKVATTLRINGLHPPATNENQFSNEAAPNSEEIKVPTQRLRVNADASLVADVELPAGYHLNPSAPQRYRVSIEAGAEQLALPSGPTSPTNDKTVSRSVKALQLPLRVPVRGLKTGSSEVRVQLTLFYCREDNTGTCHIKTLVWKVPVEVIDDKTAPNEIRVQGRAAVN